MTPAKYSKLLDKLSEAETDLARAQNKWQKLRAQVKRAAKTLDKKFQERADIAGKADWREFNDKV